MRNPVIRCAWWVALVALVLWPLAGQAQHHGGGHGGGHGGSHGGHAAFHGGPAFHGAPGHFHGGPPGHAVIVAPRRTFVGVGIGGWGGWGYPWWGYPGWGYPWWWDDYRPYYRPYIYAPSYIYPSYIYDSAGPIYYVSPDNSYVYEEPPESVPAVPEAPSASSTPPAEAVARVTVQLPTADALVYFNGARMLAQGTTRQFTTPPLEPGHDYYYTVRARWWEQGRLVERQTELHVRPGQSYTLDFTRDTGAAH
jgi:uncharacterized protein (TIGR03000 family)